MAVDLPRELRHAVELRLNDIAPGELARVTAALSERYRSGVPGGSPIARSPAQILGYAAFRLPATYAAVTATLAQVRRERPDWRPRTLLDLGAGPGAGVWAAVGVWDSLEQATALDAEPHMIALGRDLGRAASHPAIKATTWIRADLTDLMPHGPGDVVLVSYVLSELTPGVIDSIVDLAWGATSGTLVIIEPGTPAGYARVIRARTRLLAQGGFTTAPCPHDAPCPMAGDDWCHFAVRLPRSKTHRTVKHATAGYEDEKFSYIAVSRARTHQAGARVLRHPRFHPGRIDLELCTGEGLTTAIVTRSDKDAFRQARKTAWGESFDGGDPIAPGVATGSERQMGPSTGAV